MHPGKDLDEKIRVHLAVLAYCIENANQRNLQDMNIYSEGTMCQLLNMIWGCELVEAGKVVERNYPGIDLFDNKTKLYVQVTSDNTLEKIRKTLDKSRDEYGQEVQPKIVLLRFKKPNRKATIDLQDEKNRTFPNEDIIDMNTVCHMIQDIDDLDKKRQILEYVQEHMPIEIDATSYSVEVFHLKSLFKMLSELDIDGTSESDEPELSELNRKRDKYGDFWQELEYKYASVVDTRREKAFKAAFDRFDQANRERLRQYLRFESSKLLFSANTTNPSLVIALLKDKIIKDINTPLISEVEVTHFLYYQFYRCNVLPIFEVAQ